jgi:hypothetical protein
VIQSQDLLEASVPFADIYRHTRPWVQAASIGRAILLLANVAFLANLFLTACRILNVSQPAALAPPPAMEVPAP